jgi:hypothetical protein
MKRNVTPTTLIPDFRIGHVAKNAAAPRTPTVMSAKSQRKHTRDEKRGLAREAALQGEDVLRAEREDQGGLEHEALDENLCYVFLLAEATVDHRSRSGTLS